MNNIDDYFKNMSVDDFKIRDSILTKFAKIVKFNDNRMYDGVGCWFRSNECKYTLCLIKIDDNREPIYMTVHGYKEALYNFLKKIEEGKTFTIYDGKHKCGEIDDASLQYLKFECALNGVYV